MAMTDEMQVKAHITALLVIHGRANKHDTRGTVQTALTVKEAAELAVEIIQTSRRTW